MCPNSINSHYQALVLLAPNKLSLEVPKKVQYVSIPQGAAKLQLVKVRVIVFYRIDGHPHSLVGHNFAAL